MPLPNASGFVSVEIHSWRPGPFRHRAVTHFAPEHSPGVTRILRFLGKKQHRLVASNATRMVRRLQTRNLASLCHIDLSSWPPAMRPRLSTALMEKLAGPFWPQTIESQIQDAPVTTGDMANAKGHKKDGCGLLRDNCSRYDIAI